MANEEKRETARSLQKKTAHSFPCNNSDETVRHVHARKMHAILRCHFHNLKKPEMIVASYVIMAFRSFASLVGGTCGTSPENPNVFHFVDSKNSDRDVKAHLKLCNILTNFNSVNSDRNRLLARAGK